MKITLKGTPPSLNKFVGKMGGWEYRKEKQKWTTMVFFLGRAIRPPKPYTRATVEITYYFPDRRRHDPDNYCGKFLLDGLTKAGIIEDDDFSHVRLGVMGEVDRDNPRTEIVVTEEHT